MQRVKKEGVQKISSTHNPLHLIDIQCCGVEYIWETCSSCKVFHDLFNKTFSSSGSAQVYSLRIVKSLSSQTFGC